MNTVFKKTLANVVFLTEKLLLSIA